jgi:hypothetical protein
VSEAQLQTDRRSISSGCCHARRRHGARHLVQSSYHAREFVCPHPHDHRRTQRRFARMHHWDTSTLARDAFTRLYLVGMHCAQFVAAAPRSCARPAARRRRFIHVRTTRARRRRRRCCSSQPARSSSIEVPGPREERRTYDRYARAMPRSGGDVHFPIGGLNAPHHVVQYSETAGARAVGGRPPPVRRRPVLHARRRNRRR